MNEQRLITRRRLILGGLASLGGLLAGGCSEKSPPTYGHILRMGDNLTYSAHRTLLSGKGLAREFQRSDISSFPATGCTDPSVSADPAKASSELYGRLKAGGFAEWRLSVEGMVSRPGTFSLADLKRLPSRKHITRMMCEEGWSGIAEWTGVPLRTVLEAAGILPQARWVNFKTFDDFPENVDLLDALHPQTLLTYGMNGRDLPIPHGAPVRLRVTTQLGYKSVKYIQRIVVTEDFDDGGKNGDIQSGWSWYAGI